MFSIKIFVIYCTDVTISSKKYEKYMFAVFRELKIRSGSRSASCA